MPCLNCLLGSVRARLSGQTLGLKWKRGYSNASRGLKVHGFIPAMPKVYPRASFRRHLKEYIDRDMDLDKSVDVLVYLDYILFLESLLKQANIEARRIKTSAYVNRSLIQHAAKNTLEKFRVNK